MNIFNKQEITTGDRIVAYIDGKCFIRDGRGKPETLVVENFRLDDLIEYIKKKNVKSVNICGIDDLSFLSECQSIETVSYTHLDVYKRQEPIPLPKVCLRSRDRTVLSGKPLLRSGSWKICECG